MPVLDPHRYDLASGTRTDYLHQHIRAREAARKQWLKELNETNWKGHQKPVANKTKYPVGKTGASKDDAVAEVSLLNPSLRGKGFDERGVLDRTGEGDGDGDEEAEAEAESLYERVVVEEGEEGEAGSGEGRGEMMVGRRRATEPAVLSPRVNVEAEKMKKKKKKKKEKTKVGFGSKLKNAALTAVTGSVMKKDPQGLYSI